MAEIEEVQNLKKLNEISALIHEIALNFINADSRNIDRTISDALARIGIFADVDRSYVFLFKPDEYSMSNTHEWCSTGTSSHIDRLKNLPMDGPYDWLSKQILNKKVIYIPSVSDFPADLSEAKSEFQKENIQSLIMVPLAIGNEVLGFLGFDAVHLQKVWSEHDVHLLELLGSIIAQTLSRLRLVSEKKVSQQAINNIVQNMNAMVFVADAKTCEILFVNDSAKETLGDISGETCVNYEACYRVSIGGNCLGCDNGRDANRNRKLSWEYYDDKSQKWFQCRDQIIEWHNGKKACLIIANEITDSKIAYLALEHSQQLLNEAQKLSHIGNWELDLKSGELSWSEEIYRIFNLDPEHFTPSYELFIEKIHPDDRLDVDNAYTESVRSQEPYEITHRLLLDDVIKYVEERGSTFYSESGEPERSIGTIQDVTERKLAEETISQLVSDNQRLARESIQLLERERKHLSRELHDEMGQQITAIKLEADYVRSTINSSNDSEVRKSINDIVEISSELLDSVRTISEGLYPSVLDQFSLEEALTELVGNWAQRDRHRVYRLSVGNIPKINRMDIKLAAYRVLQECLSNIVHHSKATEVDVALDIDFTGDTTLGIVGSEKVLLMNIRDNGIGFNTDEAVHGIGFLSMRERVLSVNGTFSLQSSPGEGCIVTACFPLVVDKEA